MEQEKLQFDTGMPVLNAAVSDGKLIIQAQDYESGIEKVYVNGYEFSDLDDGKLEIRLQQFDAGYEYFTLQVLDHAGNLSAKYKVGNPYYSEGTESATQGNTLEELPVDAQPALPTTATGMVTEHFVTSQGTTEEPVSGKEFYTIQTDNGKVFYLIIETAGQSEKVYFLTEISENDLLNVTTDNSQTLPKNSAAVESGISITDDTLSNSNWHQEVALEKDAVSGTTSQGSGLGADTSQSAMGYSNRGAYIMMLIFAVFAAVGGYYIKVIKKKKASTEDEYDEEEEELVNEDEEQEVE